MRVGEGHYYFTRAPRLEVRFRPSLLPFRRREKERALRETMASPRGFDSAEADEAFRTSSRRAQLEEYLAAAQGRRGMGDSAHAHDDVEKPFRASDLTAAFPPRPVPLNTEGSVDGGTGGGGGGVTRSSVGAASAGGLGVSTLLPSFR